MACLRGEQCGMSEEGCVACLRGEGVACLRRGVWHV